MSVCLRGWFVREWLWGYLQVVELLQGLPPAVDVGTAERDGDVIRPCVPKHASAAHASSNSAAGSRRWLNSEN